MRYSLCFSFLFFVTVRHFLVHELFRFYTLETKRYVLPIYVWISKSLQASRGSFWLKLGKNKNTKTNQDFKKHLYMVAIENVPLEIFKKMSDVEYVFIQAPPKHFPRKFLKQSLLRPFENLPVILQIFKNNYLPL